MRRRAVADGFVVYPGISLIDATMSPPSEAME
jgi:hypothetical protein